MLHWQDQTLFCLLFSVHQRLERCNIVLFPIGVMGAFCHPVGVVHMHSKEIAKSMHYIMIVNPDGITRLHMYMYTYISVLLRLIVS